MERQEAVKNSTLRMNFVDEVKGYVFGDASTIMKEGIHLMSNSRKACNACSLKDSLRA